MRCYTQQLTESSDISRYFGSSDRSGEYTYRRMRLNRRELVRSATAAGGVLIARAQPQGTRAQANPEFPTIEGLTREVAEFIVNLHHSAIPKDVIDLGKKSILDGLGLALCGSVAESGNLSRNYIASLGLSREDATVIGSTIKAPARFAAFVNGIGIHADDYDDTQLAVAEDRVYGLLTHPTATALAAALATSEAAGRSGQELMSAYHAGVEVECKIAEAIAPRHYDEGFHSTGTCGAIGAAVAAAKVAGLNPAATRRALGIAASEAGGLRENFGTMTKPFHAGRAAESGVVAADLAKAGWTAAEQILEAPRGFLPGRRGHLRSSSHPAPAAQPLDISEAGCFHQTVSLGVPHPPRNDGNVAPHSRVRDQCCASGKRHGRDESQYAERPHSSSAEDRARGEVQHGVLHVPATAVGQGRPDGVFRLGSQS